MEILAAVKYEHIREIGGLQGRQSKVFLVNDHHLGGELVVKEVPRANFGDPDTCFDEAKKLFASAHPRVVPIQWAAKTRDNICLAMPLMTGGSLTDKIAAVPLSVRDAIKVGQDVCEGVAHVHAAGLLHLDIKPTNVLFDGIGRALVTDFGQSIRLDPLTGTASLAGHPMYVWFVPPEYFATGVASHASDVYQIGLTLCRAVNGEFWYQEQVRGLGRAERIVKISNGAFPSRDFLPHVPRDLVRVLAKAIALDPADRYQTARELASALAQVRAREAWSVEVQTRDKTVWRLDRADRADVVVERIGVPPDAAVEIWTEGGSGRRRKRSDKWATGLTTGRKLATALRRAFRAAVS